MPDEAVKEVAVTKGQAAKGESPAAPALYSPFPAMDRMFEEFFGRNWMRPLLRWDRALLPDFPAAWMQNFEVPGAPKVDVIDGDEEITVRAELPGVDKDHVSVTIAGDAMTIKAESTREKEEQQGAYHRSEIHRGSYQRSFTLPAAVDESKATATLKNGILEIVAPKHEQAKRHAVKVE